MVDRILILGASARAAAASARRAGLEPFAIDLFCDRDTRLLCDCLRCPPDEYPEGLFRLAKQAPPMPWMYTGGLENYPGLIAELCRNRELWGNGPDQLRPVRDPFALSALLSGKGLAHPEPRPPGAPLPADRQWVRKSVAGSGGLGVRHAGPDDPSGAPLGVYFQEFVPGRPMSALFAANGRRCAVLGVTGQLVGTSWLHAPAFRYAGNVVLLDPGGELRSYLHFVGFRLMTQAGLRGLYGIDFVLSGDTPYTLEVNPRYPASAEVLEHGLKWDILGWHRWGAGTATEPIISHAWPGRYVGKAIYYAPHRISFPDSGPWDESLAHVTDVWRRPDFADVPHPGEGIEPGHPVLTILTDADTEADCLARLQSRAAELDRLFGVHP